MSSVALLSAHVVAFHLKPVAFFAIHPLFSLPYIAPFCFQYINWRTELSSKLTKANNDITAINNIIKNVEIKKTNLKVAANSDFRWTWDLPTIPGYYPLEVLAWNFHGDYDLWLNVSTAARYSTSNQFGIEGHNFGNGTATVTLFVHILYVKNGFCSYVKA